jgi:hypothetical protein
LPLNRHPLYYLSQRESARTKVGWQAMHLPAGLKREQLVAAAGMHCASVVSSNPSEQAEQEEVEQSLQLGPQQWAARMERKTSKAFLIPIIFVEE